MSKSKKRSAEKEWMGRALAAEHAVEALIKVMKELLVWFPPASAVSAVARARAAIAKAESR